MKLSAHNVLPGKVIGLTKVATTAHVKIEIGSGAVITASITNEAVDALGLAVANRPARSSRRPTSWSASIEARLRDAPDAVQPNLNSTP